MILFFEYGRLGNQLFQYCGLRHYFPKHKLIFLGCEDLQRHFESVDVKFIPKSTLSRWVQFEFLWRIVSLLVTARVFGRIIEERDGEDFKLAVRRGLLWDIYVPKGIFFQHQDVVNQIYTTPSLRPYLFEEALDWLGKKGIELDSDLLIFVHIRRGDYLNWPSKEFPAVLDLVWYKSAMKFMQEKNKNAVFILMGDDHFYLRDVFEESDGLLISDNRPEIDMALMSLCHSGVLSASSFAWWGGFYARLNKKGNSIFLAPHYWGGHRFKKWFPTNFRTNWITYFE